MALIGCQLSHVCLNTKTSASGFFVFSRRTSPTKWNRPTVIKHKLVLPFFQLSSYVKKKKRNKRERKREREEEKKEEEGRNQEKILHPSSQ